MNKILTCIFIFFFSVSLINAQELFPNTEPASNCPKGVLTVRQFNEFYKEYSQFRKMDGFMFMYSVNSRLMFTTSFSCSNHHGEEISNEFIKIVDGIIDTHGATYGNPYSYRFDGVDFYAKYKFLNHDGEKRHFRMALYGELSTDLVAHDEAEPTLLGDNAGFGSGIIATQLYKKLAVSTSIGFILPYAYKQNYYNLGELNLQYGKAINYSLSFGYLLYPFRYKNYNQTNINIYMEFLGKDYQAAKINLSSQPNQIPIDPGSIMLLSGKYIDMRPGIQFIIKSNTRIDFSYALPIPDGYGGYLLGRSYALFYPTFRINFQHYFFLK